MVCPPHICGKIIPETSTKSTRAKGANRGDALMPALFCLGQHYVLAAVQQELGGNERLFAFLDDIYVSCSPGRIVPIFNTPSSRIVDAFAHPNQFGGKPKFGTEQESSPQDGRGWPQMPKRLILMQLCGGATAHFLWRIKGLLVLGTSLGSPEFVDKELGKVASKQQMLLNRIPHVSDMQCAWLLLLFCASPHPNYILRMHLCASQFAIRHDDSVKRCFEQSPQTDETTQTCRW